MCACRNTAASSIGATETMTVDGEAATVSFRRQGYLFIATAADAAGIMRANADGRLQCGR